MPWEKSFDEAEVIDQVTEIFWEKGYAATSISDITDATGIKRGSLYNAFDGKHDLFIRALEKYDTRQRSNQLKLLESVEDPREAIKKFFEFVVNDSLNDPEKKGCMLVNTALDYSSHDEAVQKVVIDGFGEVAAFFEKKIRQGQKEALIGQSIEPRPTAKALVAALVGIRVLGRGTFGKTELRQIAKQAMRLVSPEN